MVTVGPCVMIVEAEEVVTEAGVMVPMSSNQCKMQVNIKLKNFSVETGKYMATFRLWTFFQVVFNVLK